MGLRRGTVVVVLAALALPVGSASAEPIDGWQATGIDCTGPEVDAKPGSDEFRARDERNQRCAGQRFVDRSFQPLGNTVPTYGQDPYRRPERSDGRRFRYSTPSIAGVPSLEVYRPCAKGTCAGLPPELKTYQPPYPVAVVVHGFTASKELHRMNTQAFAEAGYLAIGVNGTWPNPVSAPNSSSAQIVDTVLKWLYAKKGEAAEADLNRIGMAGHSQGGAVTSSFQGDPRVKAMIIWDGGTTAAAKNRTQPMMFQTAEGGFATPTAFTDFPNTVEAAAGYSELRSRNVDTFAITGRAIVHVDFNGSGGPGGNRLWESASNYYNLAWFDRYLKGRLVLTGHESARQAAAERAHRQRIAEDAYDRLRATRFDDSADVHNISMGLWDPQKATASGDPLFGGNVPYKIAGLRVADRLSFYYRHACYVSLPDYVHGGTGEPTDAVPAAARADSTVSGDIRTRGCPGRSRSAAVPGCLNSRGGAHGRRLGPAALGRTRARQRRLLRGKALKSRPGMDRYCASGGGSFRIGYRRRKGAQRVVLAITSSRRFAVAGLRPGASVRRLRARLRGERRIRVGRNVWFLAGGRAAKAVYKTRGRRVLDVGIAEPRLARASRAFLRSWELGRAKR
jgi:dienelactone hydrolase